LGHDLSYSLGDDKSWSLGGCRSPVENGQHPIIFGTSTNLLVQDFATIHRIHQSQMFRWKIHEASIALEVPLANCH
jgi:hypothetical protein